jgi:hypothetical protein
VGGEEGKTPTRINPKSFFLLASKTMPVCPTCKAAVSSPDRVYKVTVEPEQGERGIVKRDVGMFRCPRCDSTFPRVLGRVHYLLVPETEFNRLKKEVEENKVKVESLDEELETVRKEKLQNEESLNRQLRDSVIRSLEAEVRQLEKHVKQLKGYRDDLKAEIEGNR